MYNSPQNTLFIGNNIIYVPECHSTNDVAQQLIREGQIIEGSVVITDNQLNGRGQRGAQWFSSPGKNLTFTLILKPTYLTPARQFSLSMTIALAVNDLMNKIIPNSSKIKWPNDILVLGKKICGILIENQIVRDKINYSSVGIGVNINQLDFTVSDATSLASITKKHYDLNNILSKLLKHIERRYLLLREGEERGIRESYLMSLYWLNEPHWFSDKQGRFYGKIQDIDEQGRLLVDVNGLLRSFEIKEIEFLR